MVESFSETKVPAGVKLALLSRSVDLGLGWIGYFI